ncbi:hypothetical protein PR002_g28295, partial [Phytophthora rubi]
VDDDSSARLPPSVSHVTGHTTTE